LGELRIADLARQHLLEIREQMAQAASLGKNEITVHAKENVTLTPQGITTVAQRPADVTWEYKKALFKMMMKINGISLNKTVSFS
jgi:hypothetical protein